MFYSKSSYSAIAPSAFNYKGRVPASSWGEEESEEGSCPLTIRKILVAMPPSRWLVNTIQEGLPALYILSYDYMYHIYATIPFLAETGVSGA